MKKDWAVSLGAGGVAQGMSPAKYSFNVNAAPSCSCRFRSIPDQRVDREHARQCCRHLQRRTDGWPDCSLSP